MSETQPQPSQDQPVPETQTVPEVKPIPLVLPLEELAEAFHALSDETRLRILEFMYLNPLTPLTAIGTHLGLSQPSASYHFSILERSKIIKKTKAGTFVVCTITLNTLKLLQSYLDAFMHRPLTPPSSI
jgi:DNA-binding transcriptional ArsR family regulator